MLVHTEGSTSVHLVISCILSPTICWLVAMKQHITDELKFIRFDNNFCAENHFIQLADDSRMNNIALSKGIFSVSLVNSDAF